ncbi:hypothetical protein ACPZ19_04245 [Amycolatopsis lurida]
MTITPACSDHAAVLDGQRFTGSLITARVEISRGVHALTVRGQLPGRAVLNLLPHLANRLQLAYRPGPRHPRITGRQSRRRGHPANRRRRTADRPRGLPDLLDLRLEPQSTLPGRRLLAVTLRQHPGAVSNQGEERTGLPNRGAHDYSPMLDADKRKTPR